MFHFKRYITILYKLDIIQYVWKDLLVNVDYSDIYRILNYFILNLSRTLGPKDILRACRYKSSKLLTTKNENKFEKNGTSRNDGTKNCTSIPENTLLTPEWRSEFNCGRTYQPSYNMTPTDITPVIVSTDHFCGDGSNEEFNPQSQVIVPMMWGMIPFWHKGDYRRHGLSTNNCRLEHMLESKLYRGPFRRGQRCVVLCEGFYEWQTTKSAKPSERAAHLLHMPQAESVKLYDKSTWTADNVNLLKMAGLFDIWEDENGDKIYSYSIITFESSKIMSWLHHRMPAILETEQQVNVKNLFGFVFTTKLFSISGLA